MSNNTSKISDALAFLDAEAKKDTLQTLYVLLNKKILIPKYRDITIPIDSIGALGYKNIDFDQFVTEFNTYNAEEYNRFINMDIDLTKIFMEMTYSIGKRKRYKRIKKISGIIYKDFILECKRNDIKVEYPNFEKALKILFHAYKETLINVRRRLSVEHFNKIPDELIIKIGEEEKSVKTVYVLDEKKSYYCLDKNIHLTSDDLRAIQHSIVPYIFKDLFLRMAKSKRRFHYGGK